MTDRWAVVLDGNSIDLNNASRCFGHAASRSVRIGTIEVSGGRTLPALFADSFGALSRPEDVQEEGVASDTVGEIAVMLRARRSARCGWARAAVR